MSNVVQPTVIKKAGQRVRNSGTMDFISGLKNTINHE